MIPSAPLSLSTVRRTHGWMENSEPEGFNFRATGHLSQRALFGSGPHLRSLGYLKLHSLSPPHPLALNKSSSSPHGTQ